MRKKSAFFKMWNGDEKQNPNKMREKYTRYGETSIVLHEQKDDNMIFLGLVRRSHL